MPTVWGSTSSLAIQALTTNTMPFAVYSAGHLPWGRAHDPEECPRLAVRGLASAAG
jgi:hypothetical protein